MKGYSITINEDEGRLWLSVYVNPGRHGARTLIDNTVFGASYPAVLEKAKWAIYDERKRLFEETGSSTL